MTKYYGKWIAGSTYSAKPYESENKERLIKELRTIAKGNAQNGRGFSWEVWIIEDGDTKVIARGGTTSWGKSWRDWL